MSQNFRKVSRSGYTAVDKLAVAGIGLGIIVVGIFLLVVRIILVALAVWALVFGITDWASNGVNPWAVIWTVVGGLGVLGTIASIFGRRG